MLVLVGVTALLAKYNEYRDKLAAEYKEENEFVDRYDACNEWAEC